MRIFGRKANQQSTTPTAPDVPPELQPYYGKPSLATRLRRVGLFVLPVIAALALIAALIAGGMWLKHRSDENNKVATNQPTTQKPATNNNQSQSGSESQNQNQNQSGSQSQSAQQPTNSSPSSSGSASNSASQQPSSTSQQPGAANQSAPSNIPSTGPDASMYLWALVTASIATVVAYVRQLKTVRR